MHVKKQKNCCRILQKIKLLLNKMGLYDNPEWNSEILRQKGAKIGNSVYIYDSQLDYNSCFLLNIGDRVTITGATILTHDASCGGAVGYTRLGKVKIGNDVFIGKGSIVLPGVTIGSNVVIGAGSIVVNNIPDNSIAVGNPARVIGSFDAFQERHQKAIARQGAFEKRPEKMNDEERTAMERLLENGCVYCR